MRYIVFLFLAINVQLTAQTATDIVTWISFNNPFSGIVDEFGDPTIFILPADTLEPVCGALGFGRYFDGEGQDFIFLAGDNIDKAFTTVDFTLSFYFKPDERQLNSASPQVLFSKQDGCGQDSSFAIKYVPGNSRFLSVLLSENQDVSGSLFASLPFACWHNIVVVRKGPETILYHNGNELKRSSTINGQRIPLSPFIAGIQIGSGNCDMDEDFKGVMDEIRLYKRALSREEIEDLYLFPDNIATGLRFNDLKDTTIFKGNSVQVELTQTCSQQFAWTPTIGVDSAHFARPLLTPEETTTYILTMGDSICTLTDSLRVIVVNPGSIECGDIFLPSAFTPNGDGLNDGWGISNPFSTGQILAFDIFDRWGNIVYNTTDPLEKWDGSFRGTLVNSGVFLYRLRFLCEGKEDILSGSVTVIR